MKSNEHRMRSDWPLIKHLCKTYGNTVGEAWQRLPYLTLDANIVFRHREEIHHSVPTLEYLPWDDCLIHFTNMSAYVRVTRAAAYDTVSHRYCPWDLGTERHGDLEHLHIEAWRDGGSPPSFHPQPYAAIARIDAPWERKNWAITDYPKGLLGLKIADVPGGPFREGTWDERWTAMYETLFEPFVLALAYCAICPEYLVKECRILQPEVAEQRRHNPKPWTRTDLPTIILMDPKRAPREKGEHQGGTHASPRRYMRRGHWVTLKHERFYRWPWSENFSYPENPRRYFRKQCWAGSREWKDDTGRVYRVLDTENEPRIG